MSAGFRGRIALNTIAFSVCTAPKFWSGANRESNRVQGDASSETRRHGAGSIRRVPAGEGRSEELRLRDLLRPSVIYRLMALGWCALVFALRQVSARYGP